MMPKSVIALLLPSWQAAAADLAQIPATLHWLAVTNWQDGYSEWQDGTRITHQLGTVTSNLVATVVWKGKTNGVVIETMPVSVRELHNLHRSYTLTTNRVYGPITIGH